MSKYFSEITRRIKLAFRNYNPASGGGMTLDQTVLNTITTYLNETNNIDENFIVTVSDKIQFLEVYDNTFIDKLWDDFKAHINSNRVRHRIDLTTNPNEANLKNSFENKLNVAIRESLADQYLRQDNYSLERETLGNENKLIDQRLTVFLTVQTLLFGALALLYDKGGNIPIELKHSLVGLGTGFSFFTFLSNLLSYMSSNSLEERIPGTLRNRIGFFLSLTPERLQNWNILLKLFGRFFLFLLKIVLPPTSLPLLLLYTWYNIGTSLNTPSLNASSSCKATVTEVIDELKSKEVRRIDIEEIKVPVYYNNNPTSRTKMLQLTLSSRDKEGKKLSQKSKYAIENLRKSPKMMNDFSQKIASQCDDYGVISFRDDGQTWVEEYAIKNDKAETEKRTPVDKDYNQLEWNERREP